MKTDESYPGPENAGKKLAHARQSAIAKGEMSLANNLKPPEDVPDAEFTGPTQGGAGPAEPDLGESPLDPDPDSPRHGVIKRGMTGSKPPGIYGAEGDPYVYRLESDGSVWLADTPDVDPATGKSMAGRKGHLVKEGSVAHKAIMAQINGGTLTNLERSESVQRSEDKAMSELATDSDKSLEAAEQEFRLGESDPTADPDEDPMKAFKKIRSGAIAKNMPR